MLDLPDFAPLRVTQSRRALDTAALDSLDHVLVVAPKGSSARALDAIPRGRLGPSLKRGLERALSRGDDVASARLPNARATGVTAAAHSAGTTFARLTWARKAVAECERNRPASLGVVLDGFDSVSAAAVVTALVSAASAAAFALPTFKTGEAAPKSRLRALRIFGLEQRVDLAPTLARARGNNVARWFTPLPANVLTAGAYRDAIERIAKERSLGYEFFGEAQLRRLGAGAFLAVAQGNADRDAGIARMSYRPRGSTERALALVGKGILFDTGGTNLKPFKGMLDMHMDMQGSAVALGTLLALAELAAPYPVDAWLAISENRSAANGYKPQDVVYAANGTSIQVVHTDAEGRMVLADTLAIAARERPEVIIDYATLTGACISALTELYSGVFTNRTGAHAVLLDAGAASGERVWPFPMDDDYDELIKSDVADVKQCAVENAGDHIVAARFLRRFVPEDIPWIHVDLSAGVHKGGLAHVPTDVTGFGVGFTLELLRARTPAELARRLSA